ncbi:RagB/SusD family nutrient uptake outer membrane protein [Aestuariibaculum suncheonense]|uniref:RagB/SusD family nutrient uptake outer membrane protein n=1 Tax=Aestuariibaculum suncheonense TaxID=1028745 RepID=A0A8J6Q5E6_9FLAO|nr:RagB/SusD family nutrient uptake outer membrane protein [Aestuariibaculum suncheonense]MBD0834386.1 RagB/SusD family nutrient uptake outer membrane protein [Aestuariibaculum suncheonense]
MKKILFVIPVLLTCLGCSDFLDQVDQDKLIPEKTEHYAAVMLQEFSFQYPIFFGIDYMSDNVVENEVSPSSSKFLNKPTYTWQREIEINENGGRVDNNGSWKNMYEDIAIANYTIEQIDDAIGSIEEINFVKGEAYFFRALSYFNLLNLYGQPFNPETANVDLGVPLRDNLEVDQTYSRNTVAECYALIEADLFKAIDFISMSGLNKSTWHPDLAACYLLMSRVKLYQEKWQETIDYANKVTEIAGMSKMTAGIPFVSENNSEILYSYYTTNPIFKLFDIGTTLNDNASYIANNELVDLYDDNDIRKEAFFIELESPNGSPYYRTKKYEINLFSELGFANLRVAEAYLNRAEAYAQLQDVSNAIEDIKAIHAKRYSSTVGVEYPSNADDVLSYVLNERRKELCFEDHHRWFDLRRMKNRPEIKHTFTNVDENGIKLSTETYTLLPNDLNYTLPIPLDERNRNPLIRNNERYEKIPEIVEEIIID